MLQKAKPNRKSQSALEYMMTYGWAILIIVIVAGVLYSLGIFTPSSSTGTTITGFSDFGVNGQCIRGGALQMQITNGIGYLINITRINTTGSNGQSVTINTSVLILPSQSQLVFIPGACPASAGSSYSNPVTFTYKEPGQTLSGPYLSKGTISGRSSIETSPSLVGGFEINSLSQKSQISIADPKVNISGGGYNTVGFWMNLYNFGGEMPFSFTGSDIFIDAPTCFGFNSFASDDYGTSISANKWVYVVAVFYNGAYTGNAQIYLNGTLQTLSQCIGTAQNQVASTVTYISGSGGDMYTFQGKLANFQLYNKKLSSSQVSTLYDEGIGGAPLQNAGLIGWWPLEGNTNDYSGNAYNGNALNVTWVSP